MNKTRLEAFSDGVIAILITIMVLELKVPTTPDLEALRAMLPTFVAYVLSFINLGIYWNNHHHMLQATRRINGSILWANLNLLFWLSLFPAATAWMGENHFAPTPTAVYGIILVLAGMSYTLLQTAIIRAHNQILASAIGNDLKGKISIVCYLAAIPLSYVSPWIGGSVYFLVAAIWFVPDRRIEKNLDPPNTEPEAENA